MSVCACVRASERARMGSCVCARACERASERECVRVCVRAQSEARSRHSSCLSSTVATLMMSHVSRRAAQQEASASGVRVRSARRALPVRARGLLAAHARAARLDPPHVPGAAGAPRRRALLAGPHRRLAQTLLGYTQVREQDVSHARYQRFPEP